MTGQPRTRGAQLAGRFSRPGMALPGASTPNHSAQQPSADLVPPDNASSRLSRHPQAGTGSSNPLLRDVVIQWLMLGHLRGRSGGNTGRHPAAGAVNTAPPDLLPQLSKRNFLPR